MLKIVQEHSITLTLFAASLTGLTATIGQVTKTTIVEQTSLQQKALSDQVLPAERYNNALAQSRYLVTAPELGKGEHRAYIAKQDDKPVTTVLEAIVLDGCSDAIQLLVKTGFNDTVLDTCVTEHYETLGLNDRIELRLSDWITHFVSKKVNDADDANWAVKKGGSDLDQFTGATVTPRTMVNMAKRAGLYAQMLSAQLSQLPVCGEQGVSETKDVIVQGLWKNNSALIQLFGLCPLLAVTSTVANALDLGLATVLVLALTNLIISMLRHWTPAEIHVPIYVMIIASMASTIQVLISVYAFGLYQPLGIFASLIVTNYIVMGHAEAFAVKKGPAFPTLDGLSIGMGATCAIFVLDSLREVIGNGMLFDGTDVLLGSWAKVLRVEIFRTDSPFLPATLSPGASIGLGLTLAGKYLIGEKMKKRRTEAVAGRALPNGETGNVW